MEVALGVGGGVSSRSGRNAGVVGAGQTKIALESKGIRVLLPAHSDPRV